MELRSKFARRFLPVTLIAAGLAMGALAVLLLPIEQELLPNALLNLVFLLHYLSFFGLLGAGIGAIFDRAIFGLIYLPLVAAYALVFIQLL
jgi:hypothetical protein